LGVIDFRSLKLRAWQRWRRTREDAINRQRIARLFKDIGNHSLIKPDARPVLFFNASTRLSGLSLNAAFSLLSSMGVRLSGFPVIYLVCDSGLRPCVLGTNRQNPKVHPPCRECLAQSRATFPSENVRWFSYQPDTALAYTIAALPVAELEKVEYQSIPLGRMVLPSLRWILRRHHLADDQNTRYLFRQYILSAWSLAQQSEELIRTLQPQAVVVFNGMFYPEAIVRHVAGQAGIRVVSHEVALRPFTAFFTTGEATAYPIEIAPDFELTPEQNQRLDDYLSRRFQGDFSMAGIRFWPEMRSLPVHFWERVKPFKQIVPVFTNVVFDTSQSHANVVFPHMFAWLDVVLELIRKHPETFFVVRAHPDEMRPGKESQESVADWVKARKVLELPNVMFVSSDEYFSSYELIRHSKFVMVYNSTIGLEASLLGAAVLCGGRARYTQIPTVFFPPTVATYCQQAEEFLTAETITVPPEFMRNARRFLYVQLFHTSLPFDEFLEEDGVWQGYVRLKDFSWQALMPERSSTMQTIVAGILENQPFLVKE
jgi:hypothetical protein